MRPWLLATSLTVAAAAHAAAPEGVPADDPEPWEDAWSQIVDGPPGCWEVVGRATWSYDGGRFGGVSGDAIFVGRLNDGAWQDFLIKSLGEDQRRGRADVKRAYPHGETRFVPLIGRRKPQMLARQDEGDQIFEAMARSWGNNTMTMWSMWDDEADAVVLNRSLTLGDGGEEARMKVFFPDGQRAPTRMEIEFPERFRLPERRIVTIKDADVRIQGRQAGGMTFPEAEAFSFTGSVLGFSFAGAQTITYQTFRPCGASTVAETEAIVE